MHTRMHAHTHVHTHAHTHTPLSLATSEAFPLIISCLDYNYFPQLIFYTAVETIFKISLSILREKGIQVKTTSFYAELIKEP